jgi:tetratricopeptide (TPR) repeat protein
MNNRGNSKGKDTVVAKRSNGSKRSSKPVTPVSGPGPSASSVATALPAAAPAPAPVAPLFRKIDWLVLAIAFIGVWIVYLYTLAPEQTLEDSGELCTGSFYAGIPHPPGYPFWSIYSWFWTVIIPFGNVAWRVEVGESFAAAMGCGLLAFMVSRGSSMLIEGIEELNSISRQWETAICFVSGTVAGLLLGLGQFMWIESDVINRISLFGVPWLLAMLVLLMRWSYAPHQRRYLYLAMLFFGWLATIHQSLIISVAGIEVLVALVSPRLGRDLFVWNSIGYLAILALMATGTIPALNAMTPTEKWIFHFVGLGSMAAWTGMYLKAFIDRQQLKKDWLQWFWWALFITAGIIVLVFLVLVIVQPGPNSSKENDFLAFSAFATKILDVTAVLYGVVLGVFSVVCLWTGIATRQFGRELRTGLLLGLVWIVGVSVYFYEPISCMTDPPMQWGYPRTVEGFFHTLSRGQYGSDNGLNLLQNPRQFLFQLYYLADGLSESFTWAYLFVGLIPFAFINRMRQRERNWIIGVSAIYFWISVMLVIMLNVSADRSTSELNKVFFTASHSLFAMMIGYGVTILAAYVATHYEKIRGWCFAGAGFALLAAFYCLINAIDRVYFGPTGQLRVWVPFPSWSGWSFLACGPGGQYGITEIPHWIMQAFAKDQFGMPIFANLILVALPIIFLLALLAYRTRGPVTILLVLFAVTPLCSGLAHWYICEQRNHWFGYWYGHDMFTPPFLDNGQLSYDNARRAGLMKDPKEGRLIYPEMARDAILFGGTDPGRFNPTYMIFCESFIPHYCQPKQDQKFDRRDVYLITQNALADGTYLDYLRAQYFRSHEKDPPFFSELSKYLFSIAVHSWRIRLGYNIDKHRNDTPDQLARAGLGAEDAQREGQVESEHDDAVASAGLYGLVDKALYNILDRPALAWGRHVEAYRRAEGVYPPKEIYIPSPEDLQNCFNEYYADVQRRMQTGQLQPGEDVSVDPASGKMQVSGEGSVFMINGLLCKVIFDNNPTNEFYVQESYPLPWMYPNETPFGIILKLNRNPVPELTQDDFDRDHKFWCDYSQRLCGNWITYDTTIQEITNFVQRTYIQNNFKGFTGDRRFVRDEDGQKHFSGLRSSIAGLYAWRCSPICPAEFREQTPALEQALEREADFAYKQAFAFCPYSPEAVFHYVQFLMRFNRVDDALDVARTCLELDPFNTAVSGLVDNLEKIKRQGAMEGQVQSIEDKVRKNPADYQDVFSLASYYLQTRQTNRATGLFEQTISQPSVPPDVLGGVAQFFFRTAQYPELETVLKKLTAEQPDVPEAWYDLARLEVMLGKRDDGIKDLQTSVELSDKRLKTNPAANNIRSEARTEGAFNPIRGSPEFQKLVPPN